MKTYWWSGNITPFSVNLRQKMEMSCQIRAGAPAEIRIGNFPKTSQKLHHLRHLALTLSNVGVKNAWSCISFPPNVSMVRFSFKVWTDLLYFCSLISC
jgi:hypothetical protein